MRIRNTSAYSCFFQNKSNPGSKRIIYGCTELLNAGAFLNQVIAVIVNMSLQTFVTLCNLLIHLSASITSIKASNVVLMSAFALETHQTICLFEN